MAPSSPQTTRVCISLQAKRRFCSPNLVTRAVNRQPDFRSENSFKKEPCFLWNSLICRIGSTTTTTHPRPNIAPSNEKLLLYESYCTSGKSSTWFPFGGPMRSLKIFGFSRWPHLNHNSPTSVFLCNQEENHALRVMLHEPGFRSEEL